jgi:signal peptidase I
VIRFPLDPKRDFVKRVIALPGETIEIHDRRVFVDGYALNEPYISVPGTYRYAKKQVPDHHFYVLGDNRDNSHDSHIWDWLPREYIIGKARFAYWPWRYAGVIDHPAVTFANALTLFVVASAPIAYADGALPVANVSGSE